MSTVLCEAIFDCVFYVCVCAEALLPDTTFKVVMIIALVSTSSTGRPVSMRLRKIRWKMTYDTSFIDDIFANIWQIFQKMGPSAWPNGDLAKRDELFSQIFARF